MIAPQPTITFQAHAARAWERLGPAGRLRVTFDALVQLVEHAWAGSELAYRRLGDLGLLRQDGKPAWLPTRTELADWARRAHEGDPEAAANIRAVGLPAPGDPISDDFLPEDRMTTKPADLPRPSSAPSTRSIHSTRSYAPAVGSSAAGWE